MRKAWTSYCPGCVLTNLYTDADYLEAIKLALNYYVDPDTMSIHSYEYNEDKDLWYVGAYEHGFQEVIPLSGQLVRSCLHAKTTQWVERDE